MVIEWSLNGHWLRSQETDKKTPPAINDHKLKVNDHKGHFNDHRFFLYIIDC